MQLRSRIVHLCLCSLIVCSGEHVSAQCTRSARDVAKRFLDLDHKGFRLASEGHEAIWRLTENNGDPLGMPVTLTRAYKITSETALPTGGCLLTTQFAVLGVFTEENGLIQFTPSKTSRETNRLQVVCVSGECRVNIDFTHFKIAPHPGVKAVKEWLDDLERIQTTAEAANRLEALKNQISRFE